ncbi:MAG: metal transporter permease, partial [Betaproteobacteria bacterium]|nr:metal transporter permease [Betaproteobacteria bacterium]
ASWEWDLPTGPAIVSAFGAATALIALGFALRRLSLRTLGKLMLAALAAIGVLLVAFPKMDQPWLDAAERMAPAVQTVFLSEFERGTRAEALESIERARAELARLHEVEQDVRWGRTEMEPEKLERLRQYLAGRSEISAGEQLVLRHLRDLARERQRLMLGLPLVLLGAGGVYLLSRRRAADVRDNAVEES